LALGGQGLLDGDVVVDDGEHEAGDIDEAAVK
jgi:hypothetical protein